jgi:hypothetical protein
MPATWKTVKAEVVRPGDVVRTQAGAEVTVSRVEQSFLGMPNMLAFIEDTDERWFKQPMMSDANVEVRQGAAS